MAGPWRSGRCVEECLELIAKSEATGHSRQHLVRVEVDVLAENRELSTGHSKIGEQGQVPGKA